MPAPDAAPLPRLGETFFDVRGDSRTMRLSWYADTGIAVFSIWQGGTCTGTFRLPMDDLPRLIGMLQRGPGDASGHADPAPHQDPGEPTAAMPAVDRAEAPAVGRPGSPAVGRPEAPGADRPEAAVADHAGRSPYRPPPGSFPYGPSPA
jgi:hypothetical protein